MGFKIGFILLIVVLTSQGCAQTQSDNNMEYNKLTSEESRVILHKGTEPLTDTAIFAGGCFWGVEHYLQKESGVHAVISGYIGGKSENPTYEEVCSGTSGHYEAVQVTFDPVQISFEQLAKLFFEIHDPTQWNHQGPDVGEQYRSAVFYLNDEQKIITERLISTLTEKGYKIVTEVKPATMFWQAETYHQDYYERKGSTPYCHGYIKRF